MSTIDLIVLGILLQQPRNAYDVVRYIREKEIHRVLKISEPAVFKSCRRLAEAGCLAGETVSEEGVPDKVVYAVNPQGRERFNELMQHFAGEFKPFYLDINTVLWNIDQLDHAQGRELLLGMQEQLHTTNHWLQEHAAEVRHHIPFGPRQIVKQYCKTIGALVEWIDQVVVDYEKL